MLCHKIDAAIEKVDRTSAAYKELNEVRNSLWSFKNHYKSVLVEHEILIPFSEV